ncbi:MAG: copper transporter [Syntrophomonadaceae bacterium]|nr:copper transporter [Syntrophomonadaceae bacterium]MDD3888491.1 copper transporter [Syntrophomonadaceae bacterium]MDD4548731.1 copper transporter [Syntrophomonadaceae bacterium]
MIDLRYHIASIVAVFLALGLGILIGSTIVGDNVLVNQQKKMIDRLEEQFYVLRERESELVESNEYKNQIIGNYENYSRAMLPPLVRDRLTDYKVAVVVSGDSEIPAGMLNALSVAGAEVVSKTVALSNLNFSDKNLKQDVQKFYGLDNNAGRDTLRQYIATSVGHIMLNDAETGGTKDFLQKMNLIKFSGDNSIPVDGVILVGGANNIANLHVKSFDQGLIDILTVEGIRIFGVETKDVKYSFMPQYQENNISTIDNIDFSPGQISLVLAMEGEPGHYGVKPSAQKFMPSLPVESIGGR